MSDINDLISSMGNVRIRDRTTSSQRLIAAHHRDDHMKTEIYTPSEHGTIEQFLQKYNVKEMMNQAFIVESAAFRREYEEWKVKQGKQDEKHVQTSTSSHDIKEISVSTDAATSTSTSTSTISDIKNESTDVKSSSSAQVHVRTIKYQRFYDIADTDWEGLEKEWSQKCEEWRDASINQRSKILNAKVLNDMANKYQCKSGRWMLFLTSNQDVTGIWKRCVKACNDGILGPNIEISRSSAQASTVTPAGENWKLGVWTKDYDDIHDCERVLKELKKLIPNVNAKTCSYKSKITSFLEILSRNEWNLPYKMHEKLLSQPRSRGRY